MACSRQLTEQDLRTAAQHPFSGNLEFTCRLGKHGAVVASEREQCRDLGPQA
jgi:hypothetical protein